MSNKAQLILMIVLIIALAGMLVLVEDLTDSNSHTSVEAATQAPTDSVLETVAKLSTEEPVELPAVTVPETSVEDATEVPAAHPTQAPSDVPPDILTVNRDPLTGVLLDTPATGRIFAFPINNEEASLPHVGTHEAGILFEMYVNGYFTRCLALYSDITQIETIGPIRSVRKNITDICVAFDAFLCHANGSAEVMQDLEESGVDHIWLSTDEEMAYWDIARRKKGYGQDSRLFARGGDTHQYLVRNNMRVLSAEPNQSYGLNFVEDGTPADGENAGKIDILFRIQNTSKLSTMTYDAKLGQYVYTQYGRDGKKDDPEKFENVFVMFAEVTTEGIYHVANLEGSGDGYYACNGKIVPIQWHHQNPADPITFTHIDGTPLEQGIGKSYIAIVPMASSVVWE